MTDNRPPDRLLSRREAAQLLGGICTRTLDRLIATKQLPARRVGRRVLISHTAVQRFIAQGR